MLRVRRAWKLTHAQWQRLPPEERDDLLADDWRRQKAVSELYERFKDAKAMDLGWAVALFLEML